MNKVMAVGSTVIIIFVFLFAIWGFVYVALIRIIYTIHIEKGNYSRIQWLE